MTIARESNSALNITPNTPLDSLKDVHAEADYALNEAIALLTNEDDSQHPAVGVLESFQFFIARLLADHIDATVHDRVPTIEGPNANRANVYDDGTPVRLTLHIGEGTVGTTIKPRYNTLEDCGFVVANAVETMNKLHAEWRREAALNQSEGPAVW